MLALLAAFGASASLAQQGRASAQLDVPNLVRELGLQESSVAQREQPGWRKPRAVIVPEAPGGNMDQLRAAAPGVELIVAKDLEAATAAAPRADAVIGFCSDALLARGKAIRWVQLMSAGVERCVAIPALAERGILVTNMQRVAGPVMAEHVMAMTLALARLLPAYIRQQDRGLWDARAGSKAQSLALQGKTMLIAGLGGIGTEVARRARAFGMRIVATNASPLPDSEFVDHVGSPAELTSLAREADVVINTLPLTKETAGIFDAKTFSALRPHAIFINVGRGGTVVTSELVRALETGQLGGAGLDVTDPEPLPADHPLWRAPNVIITPHVAADSDIGHQRHWQVARENLRRYVAGERMLSVVDVRRGY